MAENFCHKWILHAGGDFFFFQTKQIPYANYVASVSSFILAKQYQIIYQNSWSSVSHVNIRLTNQLAEYLGKHFKCYCEVYIAKPFVEYFVKCFRCCVFSIERIENQLEKIMHMPSTMLWIQEMSLYHFDHAK